MAIFSKLSTDNGEFSSMSFWYRAAIRSESRSVTPEELAYVATSECDDFNELSGPNAWYYETQAADEASVRLYFANTSQYCTGGAQKQFRTPTVLSCRNKPLPPLPTGVNPEIQTSLAVICAKVRRASDYFSEVGDWTDDEDFIQSPMLLSRHDGRNSKVCRISATNNTGSASRGASKMAINCNPFSTRFPKLVQKRSACDSFAKNATSLDESDDEIVYIKTKRVCREGDVSGALSPTVRAISCISISDESESDDTPSPPSDRDYSPPVESLSTPRQLYTVPTSFPGQFVPKTSQAIRRRIATSTSARITFEYGDPTHPNNTCVHTNFFADPDYEVKDFTSDNLPQYSDQYHALLHADHMLELAGKMQRTEDEEYLRREAHHECAAARLEDCSVGRYRYYWGHLSLEEYRDANICICWDWCVCAKMCSRYADILCPCSTELVIHQD